MSSRNFYASATSTVRLGYYSTTTTQDAPLYFLVVLYYFFVYLNWKLNVEVKWSVHSLKMRYSLSIKILKYFDQIFLFIVPPPELNISFNDHRAAKLHLEFFFIDLSCLIRKWMDWGFATTTKHISPMEPAIRVIPSGTYTQSIYFLWIWYTRASEDQLLYIFTRTLIN